MLSPTTNADRIFSILRDQILFGDLQPGTRLVQRKLAAEFGASSIPVVEAIRRLEGDGLIVTHPKWGAQVRTWSIEDIEANYSMREGLEGVTCRLFAERATENEKLGLIERNRIYESTLNKETRAATEADMALHLFIVQATKVESLCRMVEQSCILTATICLHSSTEDRPGVHDDLVNALVSGDPQKAANAGRAHVRDAMEKILKIWRKK